MDGKPCKKSTSLPEPFVLYEILKELDQDLNFEIIEAGDHVICAVTKQKVYLQNLNYWNVELQEPYFSYKEAQLKREESDR